jgi:predicted  nucleic acid-binding Zn-ribbon protein
LLKKSPDPPIKIQKDKKMILDMKKNYFKQFENNEYQTVLEDILIKQKFFVQIDSDGNKFIESILRQLNNLIAKITEKKDLQSLLVEIEDEIREIEIRIEELEDALPKLKDEIESFRKESGIYTHLSEKEKLLSDPDLSLFLKIITLGLEKYVKMVERRENRKLDQREDFLGLILEPTRFNNLTEDLWREIVYIIESHALELISSKSWFKFKNSDDLRNFIVKKDVLEKYARIRKLESTLDSIEQNLSKNPQYSEDDRLVKEFNEKRSSYAKLNEKIPEVKEKIDTLSHELKIEEEKVFTYLV